jgi:hypothetical protein
LTNAAPGGPEEDPTGGFTLGGWTSGYADEGMDISASGFDGKDRELVLGRRTLSDIRSVLALSAG